MKVISYSLFGYNKERHANCFDFNSYFRGLNLNIRLAAVLFPDWTIRVHMDNSTYLGFKDIFDALPIQIKICESAELTHAMLWRLLPAFDETVERFICRDLDGPLMPRDRQAVLDWENSDMAAHSITDSVSHNIEMLGGMVGFKSADFRNSLNASSLSDLISNANEFMSSNFGRTLDFSTKGEDQTLLCLYVYPKFRDSKSIKQHYVLGMKDSGLPGYSNTIPDLNIGLDESTMNSLGSLAGHIGAAGFYDSPMTSWLIRTNNDFKNLYDIEKPRADIYYWINIIDAYAQNNNSTNE